MKTAGTSFDVTALTETIVDALRARLPAIVAREVAQQLAAASRAPRLTDAELRERNALRVASGLRPLPGVELPPAAPARARPRGEALDEIARIRARQP
jgi:hypothetical protein